MENPNKLPYIDHRRALELLRFKTQERMKHSLTGDNIISLEDVNEVLLIAGMELIDKKIN